MHFDLDTILPKGSHFHFYMSYYNGGKWIISTLKQKKLFTTQELMENLRSTAKPSPYNFFFWTLLQD